MNYPMDDCRQTLEELEQYLDGARFQHRGERIMFLLRLGDPRQAVEQQRVVVARREALQFGPGAVQDDDTQLADLGVAAQRNVCHI